MVIKEAACGALSHLDQGAGFSVKGWIVYTVGFLKHLCDLCDIFFAGLFSGSFKNVKTILQFWVI